MGATCHTMQNIAGHFEKESSARMNNSFQNFHNFHKAKIYFEFSQNFLTPATLLKWSLIEKDMYFRASGLVEHKQHKQN